MGSLTRHIVISEDKDIGCGGCQSDYAYCQVRTKILGVGVVNMTR